MHTKRLTQDRPVHLVARPVHLGIFCVAFKYHTT